MVPLGFVENYQSLREKISDVLSDGKSVAFLLECPNNYLLENSGLISSHRSVEEFDKLSGSRLNVFYLTPQKLASQVSDQSELGDQESDEALFGTSDFSRQRNHNNFNRLIVEKIGFNYEIEYPCLILLRADNGEKFYYHLGRDKCFYFQDVYKKISDFVDDIDEEDPARVNLKQRLGSTYQSIKDDLPKHAVSKSFEILLMGICSTIAGFL